MPLWIDAIPTRMQNRGGLQQMPPLATKAIDHAGIAAVNAWLDRLRAEFPPGAPLRPVSPSARCNGVEKVFAIEDATGERDAPIYDFNLAVERVHAAVEAARALPVPFVLTARAEGLLHQVSDLDEIIRRLQAFERAGADVLYAPALRTLAEMRSAVQALTRPINVVMGFADPAITLDDLRAIGVRRVSIGGALSRVAPRAFLDAASEMRAGRFGFVRRMISIRELHAAF